LFGIWAIATTLALIGLIRLWWAASLAALPLLLLMGHRKFEGGDLDPFPWLRGARGEEAVAQVLAHLEQVGYQALHDIETGHGNIDHVVVGPTGVFAIETKHLSGRLSPKNGRLTHNGRDATKIVRQATRSAIEVKRRLAIAGVTTWVEALVVSTKAEVLGKKLMFGHVTVMEPTDLPVLHPPATHEEAVESGSFPHCGRDPRGGAGHSVWSKPRPSGDIGELLKPRNWPSWRADGTGSRGSARASPGARGPSAPGPL